MAVRKMCNSLFAVPEDVKAGVKLQSVGAVWFVLDHSWDTKFRLRKEKKREVTVVDAAAVKLKK